MSSLKSKLEEMKHKLTEAAEKIRDSEALAHVIADKKVFGFHDQDAHYIKGFNSGYATRSEEVAEALHENEHNKAYIEDLKTLICAGEQVKQRLLQCEAMMDEMARAAQKYLLSREVVDKELDWDAFEAFKNALQSYEKFKKGNSND